MKEYSLTALTGSRYITDNWKHWILRRDIIKKLTKEQFSNLLEYKLACKDHYDDSWEAWYFEVALDTPTETTKSIKLEISCILLSSWWQDNKVNEKTQEQDKNQETTVETNPCNLFYIKKWNVVEIDWKKVVFQDDYPLEAPKELIDEIINMKNESLTTMQPQVIEVVVDNEGYKVNANSIILEN